MLNKQKMDELKWIKEFVRGEDFSEVVSREQLRSLWTAYCLRSGLIVDTLDYDMDLEELWYLVEAVNAENTDWHDGDSFEDFMCAYLV